MQWMLSLKSVLHIKVMEIGVSLSEILKENFLPGEEGGGASKKAFSLGRKEGASCHVIIPRRLLSLGSLAFSL